MRKKMKLKKLMALCLSLVMAVGMFAMNASASIGEADKGTINVSGVEDGVTVNAYRLMDVSYDYDADQPLEPTYTWNDSVAAWVRTNYPTYIGEGADDTVQKAFADAEDIALATFYDALAAAIKNTTSPLEVPVAGTCTGSGSITGLDMGNYLILIENGMRVYRPSAVNVVPSWNEEDKEWVMTSPTVEVKSSEVSIDKSVNEDVNDGHDSGKDKAEQGSDNANIGDTVSFDLRAGIPQYPENAIFKTYTVSDVLPAGLTLNEGTVTVKGVTGEGETDLTGTDAYTSSEVRPGELGASSFTLTFDYDKIKTYESVHIEYTAVLNKDAAIGTTGNKNTAYLDYSNNPYSATYQTKSDFVTVYSYGIDITKVNSEGDTLPGAQFELSTTDGGEAISFIGTEGSYRRALSGESGVTTLEVDESGKLVLTGLDAGTWYLKETKAPDGYHKPSESVSILISDDDRNGSVTVGQEELDSGIVPVEIENSQGITLPTTGGIGTILFTVGGILLMGLGLTLFLVIVRRRKAS